MIDIPDVVANKARSVGSAWWLEGLPALVAGLEADWGISVGSTFADGTEGWVAEAVDGTGRAVVLKLCLPRAGDDPWANARHEAAVLERAGGRGCVELLASDVDRGALLLERLGPSLADLNPPFEQRLAILADLATRFWSPGQGLDLVTGAAKAEWLTDYATTTWESLGRPCRRATIDQAVEAARRRGAAHDDRRARLVHGDIHPWNTLRIEPQEPADTDAPRWKLIDPDGLVAEPEYDLGILLREDPEELAADIEAGQPRRRAEWLAERTGTDAQAIWEWGLIERVSTGLMAVSIELEPVGSQMLAVADRLALDRTDEPAVG